MGHNIVAAGGLLAFNVLCTLAFSRVFLVRHEAMYTEQPELLVRVPRDFMFEIVPPGTNFGSVTYLVPSNLVLWAAVEVVCCSSELFSVAWRFLEMWLCQNVMYGLKAFCMALLPLAVPEGNVDIHDPFAAVFTGRTEEFRMDLFFSGHTATICIVFLFLLEARTRISRNPAAGLFEWFFFVFAVHYCFLCILQVGLSLISSRSHYSIDVFVAPFMAYCAYRIGAAVRLVFF